jgi:putative ABC transport system permease protein
LGTYEVCALRERSELFAAIEASTPPFQVSLTSDDGDPEQIRMMNLSPGYLEMLGVPPLAGRVFVQEEGTPVPPEVFQDPDLEVPPSVALLDFEFWNRRFGGDPDVVGRDLTINSRRFRVIGIMPEGFRIFVTGMAGGQVGNQRSDVYGPLEVDFDLPTSAGFLVVIGRRAEGVAAAQAQEEIAAISTQLRENHDRSKRGQIYTSAASWGSEVSRDVRLALLALLGAVTFVQLIACANVANLLLARAASRRQEIAVRAALGAKRGRIIRQVLTESALLAGVGGFLGLLVASWGVRVLLALQPDGMPRSDTVGISVGVLLFTLAATLLAVVLFGLAPALALSGVRGNVALNERGTGGGSLGRSRFRSSLVVGEVALSLVLLVGAGLMLRSFGHLNGIDPGFRPDSVWTFQVQLPGAQYRVPEVRQNFVREVLRSIEALPGVESVGAATALPLTGALFAGSFRTETMSEEDPGIEANFRGVTAGFFRAMGTPILHGRDFDPLGDNNDLILVDQQLAKHTFPGENVLGRRIRLFMPTFPGGPPSEIDAEIIGVVADVRDDGGLEAPSRRTVYLPQRVISFGGGAFAVRTSIDPDEVFPRIRELIAALDPAVPLFAVRPMRGYVDDALAPVRFMLILIGLFGAFALVQWSRVVAH